MLGVKGLGMRGMNAGKRLSNMHSSILKIKDSFFTPIMHSFRGHRHTHASEMLGPTACCFHAVFFGGKMR